MHYSRLFRCIHLHQSSIGISTAFATYQRCRMATWGGLYGFVSILLELAPKPSTQAQLTYRQAPKTSFRGEALCRQWRCNGWGCNCDEGWRRWEVELRRSGKQNFNLLARPSGEGNTDCLPSHCECHPAIPQYNTDCLFQLCLYLL